MVIFFLQLRNELWKLFAKKRTYMGFSVLLLTQFLVGTIFRFTHATNRLQQLLETNGHVAATYISALTIATYMLIPINDLLLPLYTSLIGGDLVAKETEDGTLRMILARPISRIRLLLLKWLAGFVFSTALIAALAIFGVLFARIYFPWGNLFFWDPVLNVFGVFDGAAGFQRYLLAHLLIIPGVFFVMSLAFMFSCMNAKPSAATILALSFLFANFVLENLFQSYREWFVSYHVHFIWQWVFMERIPWWQIGESLTVLVGGSFTFLIIGCAVFQIRDFKT